MLFSVEHLSSYTVEAEDGNIGQVHGFLFDDNNWAIRYLVVDTGKWLPGRKVLLAPSSLGRPEGRLRILPVKLTREKVENSPDIDTDRPVSRQQESELHAYYNWASYWGGGAWEPTISPYASGIAPRAGEIGEPEGVEKGDEGNPHLRSTREVIGYRIHAEDGAIGHSDDFVVNIDDWIIRYLVVDIGKWLSGRKVIIPPEWVTEIRWDGSEILVDVTKEEVRKSPEFDPAAPVNREYEVQLYDFYGRPAYWL
ncbi:MAG: PRC-barrel domain-containing protein [Phycisphaerae bacterium]|nr:PRC-barrel domain-containing protein [Phycisphaerae bacterium]